MTDRLQAIPIDDLDDPYLREQARATREQSGGENFITTLGPQFPDLFKSFFEFYSYFMDENFLVNNELVELMRIKCYSYNECRL